MTDRIEELLGPLAAEEDEKQEEDVLALPVAEEAVPASPRGNEGEAGDGETDDRSGGRTAKKRGAVVSGGLSSERSASGEAPEGRTAFAQSESSGSAANRRSVTTEKRESGDRSGGRTVGEIVLERPGLIAGETAAEQAQAHRELWKDGPVWTVRGGPPEIDGVLRAAQTGRTARPEEAAQQPRDGNLVWAGPEWTAHTGTTGTALEVAGRSGAVRAGMEQAGLKGLYRQTVRGLRPAAPALPPEQAGGTARAQEPGSAASLAVDELDRAVRRDSRRYDGGMSIY